MASEILGNTWNLSSQGVELITAGNTIKDKQALLKKALDTDLKEIGASVLSKELTKGVIKEMVLQIQKVRNISAPKANENSQAAPRMLKLILTDGDTYVQAIEVDPISSLSLEKTAPGSKVLLNSAPISSGYVLINSKNCTHLGGKVPALYEKWELARSVQHYNRNNRGLTTDGAPLWVNFGSKKAPLEPSGDHNFKSLDNNKNKDTAKDNSEFELQRQGAIAEASTGAVKKVFGGGTKQHVISTTNPMPKRNDYQHKESGNNNRSKGKFTKTSLLDDGEVEDIKPQKPPERVSLFDFLEDKLPAPVNQSVPSRNYNNYDQFYQSQNQNDVSFYKGKNPRPPYNPPQNPRNNSYQKFDNNRSKPFENNTKSYQPEFSKSKSYDNKPKSNNFNQSRDNPERSRTFNNYQDGGARRMPIRQPPEKPEVAQLVQSVEKLSINSQFPRSNNFNQPRDYQEKSRTFNNYQDGGIKKAPKQSLEKPEVAQVAGNVMSMNNQFASRSLRQHLNLGSAKKIDSENQNNVPDPSVPTKNWKAGEECMAKYWEDNKYYKALITAVTDATCVVKFQGYNNVEEILKADCIPVNDFKRPQGTMEFRRKPTRKQ